MRNLIDETFGWFFIQRAFNKLVFLWIDKRLKHQGSSANNLVWINFILILWKYWVSYSQSQVKILRLFIVYPGTVI